MSYDPIDHNFERGLNNRRAILGDAWVDRSLGNANNFNADFQNLITRFAWNEIWGRPGLEQKPAAPLSSPSPSPWAVGKNLICTCAQRCWAMKPTA